MSVHNIVRGEGSRPIYRQIADILQHEVRNLYQAGDLLPSEADMAERFQVNRHTLRRAVDELIGDGLVTRRHGVGIQVLEPSIDYAINSHSRFTQNLETLGIQSSSKVIYRQVIPAQGGVVNRLAVAENSKIMLIETLREINNKPLCIISHYLPYDMFKTVFENYRDGSLHTLLKNQFGIQVCRQESFMSAVLPEANDALLLKMPRFEPVLRVKSINVNSQTQTPVEYSIARFRGDAVQLSVKT